MEDKNIKRVACYVRVSTENQLENYSIDEQTERLKSYCHAKDWAMHKIYTDGGYSGGNIDRPALQQLLKDIRNNLIDMVVVYKLDRLSRSQKDTLTLIEDEFLVNNVDFVSMNENFDTSTPFGRAMIGILSVFAQLEKDQITERFTMGRIGRAKNGFFHGGPTAPTGYDYINGDLVVNEYEALQIREVFDRFLKGQSINSIKGYMGAHYTNKYGNWSSHALVINVLRNSTYIGNVKFKGKAYVGNHTPIISEEVYNTVQKLLTCEKREDSKSIYQKTPFRANNLLTSILFCKKCGARFSGNHGDYVCYSRGKTDKKRIKDPNCRNKRWKIEELDKVVKSEILKLSHDSDYFDQLFSDAVYLPVANNKHIIDRVIDIDKQVARMIDLYQVGDIPLEQISDRIAKLKQEKDTLAKELEDNSHNKLPIEEAKDMLSGIENILEGDDTSIKRLAVSTLIDYIEIDDLNILIHWSFV